MKIVMKIHLLTNILVLFKCTEMRNIMNTTSMIQPLLKLCGLKTINETFIQSPVTIYMYEAALSESQLPDNSGNSDNSDSLSLSFIPSPYNEWIIGFNDNDDSSDFYCIGAVTRLTSISLKKHDHYIGLRFNDTACYYNKGVSNSTPPKEMLNKVFVYEPSKESCEYNLVNAFKKAGAFNVKADLIREFLSKEKTLCPIPYGTYNIMDMIKGSNGNINISAAAEKSGYSPRHIHRLFINSLGFSPKDYCRYIRFQKVVSDILKDPMRNNSEFIMNIGYSDQAHFQREFKAFTGITPRQFISYHQKNL